LSAALREFRAFPNCTRRTEWCIPHPVATARFRRIIVLHESTIKVRARVWVEQAKQSREDAIDLLLSLDDRPGVLPRPKGMQMRLLPGGQQ
jgi:hypothetical protein